MKNRKTSLCTVFWSVLSFAVVNSNAQDTYPLHFPASNQDLSFGSFWSVPKPHAWNATGNDIFGKKYNTELERWQDSSLFGAPVYAASDGLVIAGWRGYPDNVPWEDVKQDQLGMRGGNNLVILTDDGHIVFYAHLKQNSIPAYLLPQSTTTNPVNDEKLGVFPVDYIVPENQRQRVKLGQFLGEVGDTGNSGYPHLHIHVQEISELSPSEYTLGDVIPIRFYGASMVQDFSHGSISESWQTMNGHVLNTVAASGPVVILPEEGPLTSISSRSDGKLDVFSKNNKRQLQIKIWNGNDWSNWKSLGGTLTSNPSCTSWSENRIDCVSRNLAMQLQHKYWSQSSGWSSWSSHDGLLTTKPTVSSRGPGLLDVFARGRDFALKHKSWNGSNWSDWSDLGGKLNSAPSCTSWSESRIDCVVRGQSNQLYHIYWNGVSWSDWTNLNGALKSGPAVISRGENTLDIFARGQNDHLWLKQWLGNSWSEWLDLGGSIQSSPSVVSMNNQRIDIQAMGQNGNIWHLIWTATGGWEPWKDFGSI